MRDTMLSHKSCNVPNSRTKHHKISSNSNKVRSLSVLDTYHFSYLHLHQYYQNYKQHTYTMKLQTNYEIDAESDAWGLLSDRFNTNGFPEASKSMTAVSPGL